MNRAPQDHARPALQQVRIATNRNAALVLFDHLQSQSRFGASVFSIRPSTVLLETVDEFIAFWQIKRDQSEHGIVEIILE